MEQAVTNLEMIVPTMLQNHLKFSGFDCNVQEDSKYTTKDILIKKKKLNCKDRNHTYLPLTC